mgnify:CR=1 FL=1
MKLITSITLALAGTLWCVATPPDMADSTNLSERFTAGETLQADEAANVYYGAVRRPGFNATADYPDVAKAYSSGDMAGAYRMSKEALAKDPTNLSLLFKAYAAATATNAADARAFQQRILQICDAIFASGKGVSEQSPYIVTRQGDIDEFLMKYIQPSSVTGRAKLGNLDAVKVTLEGVPDEVILYFKILK